MSADEVAALRAQVVALQAELRQLRATPASSSPPPPTSPPLPPTSSMSADVLPTNPFSRVMALQSMGVIPSFSSIRLLSVAIVGVGGVGSVAAEMLTRCGIGRLHLFDYDRVELANMNRLFFQPSHVGLPKVIAAQRTLHSISPATVVTPYDLSVTSLEHHDTFLHALRTGSVDSSHPVSLLLCCVDNFDARVTVNRACLQLRQVWMESGVSEDALNGHVQVMYPGRTACYECAPPLTLRAEQPEVARPGVCAASLPTTMGLIAALLVQAALKMLLGWGRVSGLQGYRGEADGFERWEMKVNAECEVEECRRRQAEWQGKEGWEEEQDRKEREREGRRREARRKAREHDTNVWGIQLVADSGDDCEAASHGSATQPHGHTTPNTSTSVVADTGDLEQLLAELQRAQQ